MELQQINQLLKNLENPDPKVLKFIKKIDVSTPIPNDGYGSQGEENVFDKVYQSATDPDIYIKVTYYTDSYGYGEYVRSVQFVQPKEKVVTVFE